jgi:TetR/AcrR family transcriptional regulator, regulator of cefoperazone and chloramphenicol sensitivity
MSDADPRLRLLETAGEIFAEKGFRAATVREICKAADANIAAVNYYFGDKMGMYVEAVKHAHLCRFNEPPPSWPDGTPAEQKLYDFVHNMLRHLLDPTRPAWNAKLMIRELSEPTQACKAITEQYIRPMATVLMGVLLELLPEGASLDRIQMTAFSVVGQCLFYRIQEPVAKELVGAAQYSTFTVDRLADHIATFSLAALGRTPVHRTAALAGQTP